ncbi:MAG: hypothetical protein JXR76_14650 [Deltaproteobacteria bacterium]|nr:hypothetical protein [Deltaproteobacteria bacterium]
MVSLSSSEQLSLAAENAGWLKIHPGYSVFSRIGEDASGPLYRGKSVQDNRQVVIRLFTQDTAPHGIASGHSVVPLVQLIGVQDVLLAEDGLPLAVMAMPKGICLATLLEKKMTLPPNTALQIALKVSLVLRSLHMHEIVHGHVDAQNIFVRKAMGGTLEIQLLYHRLTGLPSDFNFPGNLSPELCTGKVTLCESDDAWATVVLLHRMLLGTMPFSGDSHTATCRQILSAPLKLPGAFERDLQPLARLLKKGLAKNPIHRFDARELNLALKSLLSKGRGDTDPLASPSVKGARMYDSAGDCSPLHTAQDVSSTYPHTAQLPQQRRLMERETATGLSFHNDTTETRPSIDTRLLAKQEKWKAKRRTVFQRVSQLMTSQNSPDKSDVAGDMATID